MWEAISGFVSENYQIISIAGALFAFYKWHVSQKQREVEFLHSMIGVIRRDDMYDFIRSLDYEDTWYNEKFHNGPLELKVDKVLMEFSYLCHLRKTHMISGRTFDFFRYDIDAILSDPQMKDYFYNLYRYAVSANTMFPFIHLLKYAFEKKYMDKRVFDDPESWKDGQNGLHRYLEFKTKETV